jgi:hypothetical protein
LLLDFVDQSPDRRQPIGRGVALDGVRHPPNEDIITRTLAGHEQLLLGLIQEELKGRLVPQDVQQGPVAFVLVPGVLERCDVTDGEQE